MSMCDHRRLARPEATGRDEGMRGCDREVIMFIGPVPV